MIDKVEVKTIGELSPNEIEHDNPEIRHADELCRFLGQLYNREVTESDTVTVIRFSAIKPRTASKPPRRAAGGSRSRGARARAAARRTPRSRPRTSTRTARRTPGSGAASRRRSAGRPRALGLGLLEPARAAPQREAERRLQCAEHVAPLLAEPVRRLAHR